MSNTTNYRYRATCSCGYKGRWFVNGNDAVAAEEQHLFTADHNSGRYYDRSDRGHSTAVEEVAR
jgi:hypothetical protein